MVRSVPADGSPAAHRAVGRERSFVDKSELLGKIVVALRGFTAEAEDEGRALLQCVTDCSWNAERLELSVPVAVDPQTIHRVTISLKRRSSADFRRACTCEEHALAGVCPHAWTALYHLYSELSSAEARLEISTANSTENAGHENRAAAPKAGWAYRLDALDRVIGTDRLRRGDARPEAATARTAWRVDFRRGHPSTVIVTPVEQRSNDGKWTRGRKIAWPSWLRSPDLWREPEDREVAELVRTSESVERFSSAQSVTSSVDSFDILLRLLDHPRLFDAADPARRLDARRGELGVRLQLERDGRVRLVAQLDGRDLADSRLFRLFARGLVYSDPSKTDIVLAKVDGSRRTLIAHLLEEDLTFPDEARDELLARLPALEALFPIELPETLNRHAVAADDRVHALLRPVGAGGLAVSVRFRPLPGGADWPPGEGFATHGRMIDKRWVSTSRDLERERRLALRFARDFGLATDEASESERDWTWELADIDDALRFVCALQHRDDDRVVVEWPDGRFLKLLTRRLGPGELRVSVEDGEDLFGLDGFVDVDGARVALALLLERVRQGSRFVPVDDSRWAEISDVLHARLEMLSEVARTGHSGVEVAHAALPAVEEALEDSDVERSLAWQETLDRFQRAADLEPVEPDIKTELRPYQREGFRWMTRLAAWGVGACLADDMGLGKTVQTLAILSTRTHTGPGLVVAPTSVTHNWVRETERFVDGLRPVLYSETNRGTPAPCFRPGELVIVSYGLLRRDIDRLAKARWGSVVLDEAQSIKNSRSQTSRAVSRLRSDWRLALTGTPIENHLGELWSLFEFLTPGLLSRWEDFRRRFAEPIENQGDDARRRALAKLTRPFFLRRKKSEVLKELPPRTDVCVRAKLSPGERALYEDARLSALASLSAKTLERHKDLRFDVLAALTKLRQLACHPKLAHPDLDLTSAKSELFLELVENLRRGGHRALVFSQFTRFLGLVRSELEERGFRLCYLDGGTSAKERARQVDRFQAGEADVFLISLKAGGTGLNLTAADYVVHLDPWWNPAVEDQATDRAHRLGQTRPVTVYRLLAEGTIEEEIQKMQAAKRALIAGVVDGADGGVDLTTEELIDLIRSAREESDEEALDSAG